MIAHISASTFSKNLKEIVYGGTDGIITTFAVVAGFTGAQSGQNIAFLSTSAIILFGFANLFADATSMSFGDFLAVKADKDAYEHEKEKKIKELIHLPKHEIRYTHLILKQKGFSEEESQKLTDLYVKNKAYWADFLLQENVKMVDPENIKPAYSALITFISFIVFGIIPVLPFVYSTSQNQFYISTFFTFVALIILGLIRYAITNRSLIKSVGEILFLGGISSIIAYIVGSFIRI